MQSRICGQEERDQGAKYRPKDALCRKHKIEKTNKADRSSASFAASNQRQPFLTVSVPITIRNYVIGDDHVLIASQGGVNFYIGNNPDADGCSAIIEGDPADWWSAHHAQIARGERALGHPPKGSEVSKWYLRQALHFMRDRPGQAARLLVAKLSYFWSHWEISNYLDIRFITSNYTPIVAYLPIGFWIIGLPASVYLGFGTSAGPLGLWWGLVVGLAAVALFLLARVRARMSRELRRIMIDDPTGTP